MQEQNMVTMDAGGDVTAFSGASGSCRVCEQLWCFLTGHSQSPRVLSSSCKLSVAGGVLRT